MKVFDQFCLICFEILYQNLNSFVKFYLLKKITVIFVFRLEMRSEIYSEIHSEICLDGRLEINLETVLKLIQISFWKSIRKRKLNTADGFRFFMAAMLVTSLQRTVQYVDHSLVQRNRYYQKYFDLLEILPLNDFETQNF